MGVLDTCSPGLAYSVASDCVKFPGAQAPSPEQRRGSSAPPRRCPASAVHKTSGEDQAAAQRGNGSRQDISCHEPALIVAGDLVSAHFSPEGRLRKRDPRSVILPCGYGPVAPGVADSESTQPTNLEMAGRH